LNLHRLASACTNMYHRLKEQASERCLQTKTTLLKECMRKSSCDLSDQDTISQSYSAGCSVGSQARTQIQAHKLDYHALGICTMAHYFLAEFKECHPLHVATKYYKGVTFPKIRPKSRTAICPQDARCCTAGGKLGQRAANGTFQPKSELR
jgi:hypothetical protein